MSVARETTAGGSGMKTVRPRPKSDVDCLGRWPKSQPVPGTGTGWNHASRPLEVSGVFFLLEQKLLQFLKLFAFERQAIFSWLVVVANLGKRVQV